MSEASGSGGRAGGGAALAIAPAALAAAIALAALALALLAAPARAAGLDQRFGDDGRAAIGFDFEGSRPEPGVSASWEESNVEAIAGPRGSTIVVGKHQIVRLGADGRLDRGFGADGRLAPTDLAGLAFRLESAAVDGRGRLLVFGTGEDLGVSRRIGISAPAGGVDAHPS